MSQDEDDSEVIDGSSSSGLYTGESRSPGGESGSPGGIDGDRDGSIAVSTDSASPADDDLPDDHFT